MPATKKRKKAGRTQQELLCSGLVADRLGSLPDELIGRILSLLPIRQAVLTSQLSRRWRRVWALCAGALNLSVQDCAKWRQFRVLAREAVLHFPTPDIPSISVEIDSHVHIVDDWLDQAMERAVGSVRFASLRPLIGLKLELPHCTRAQSLAVSLPGTVLSLPALAFVRLTELSLSMVRLGGARPLDEFVSSCCPRLSSLRLCGVRGEPVRRLALHTDALEVLDVNNVEDLTRLDVVAAKLRRLSVRSCFRLPSSVGFGEVTVSAPSIETLHWYRSYPKQLSFRADLLKHAARLSGIKLPALGRRDQFDFPYTIQLLKTCILADHLDMELVMPDEMTLLNLSGPEGAFEDLIRHVPQLPNARDLSLTIRWGFGGNVTPSLASLLSRAPNLTRLHIFANPYCLTVFEGGQVMPPQVDHRWGRVHTDGRLHHDGLRQINVDGLMGTDLEEYKVIELLLGSVPPSLERMSLRFGDAAATIVDEVAAEITARFPMANGSWARCPPNVLTWNKVQELNLQPRCLKKFRAK